MYHLLTPEQTVAFLDHSDLGDTTVTCCLERTGMFDAELNVRSIYRPINESANRQIAPTIKV
jgi:hypothetical protein